MLLAISVSFKIYNEISKQNWLTGKADRRLAGL
jgi:hypothetical protein